MAQHSGHSLRWSHLQHLIHRIFQSLIKFNLELFEILDTFNYNFHRNNVSSQKPIFSRSIRSRFFAIVYWNLIVFAHSVKLLTMMMDKVQI
jgi:hypothetical protein